MGRSAGDQDRLERAVAAIDRELAANLELTSMFDQTKQAFVLENGQWQLHAATIGRELPEAHAFAADLYGGTFRLLERVFKPWGLVARYTEDASPEGFRAILRPGCRTAMRCSPCSR